MVRKIQPRKRFGHMAVHLKHYIPVFGGAWLMIEGVDYCQSLRFGCIIFTLNNGECMLYQARKKLHMVDAQDVQQ